MKRLAPASRAAREAPHASPEDDADAKKPGDAQLFAELSLDDRPIQLFTSLRAARRWAAEMVAAGK